MLLKRFLTSIAFCLAFVFAVYGQKESSEVIISRAKIDFASGRFESVIEYLGKYLNHSAKYLTYPARVEAQKLVAQSYIGLDSMTQAERHIQQLLVTQPDFEPSYDDSPIFIKVTENVRRILASKQTSSVSKKAENIEEVPATIVIISEEDIRNRGYRDLEALFHDISGFDISRSMGLAYSNLYQRGFRSAANTDRTMLLMDGMEDNELWSNTAFISRQYPISNIKRVEIIYGPSSTTYGANAFLGVVNVVTKNEVDLFKGQKKYGLSAQAAYGSMNTRYVDLTGGFERQKLTVTMTGRFFLSEERDLSQFEDWDYQWNPDLFANHYYNNLSITNASHVQQFMDKNPSISSLYQIVPQGDSTVIRPTDLAIQQAQATDALGYQTDSRGNPLRYSNPTDNMYLSGKLKSGNFQIGFHYWNRAEGAASAYSDGNIYSGSLNGTMWTVRQWLAYAKFEKYVTGRLYIANQSTFRVNGFFPDTRIAFYRSYGNGDLGLDSLVKDVPSYWLDTYFSQRSTQFRNEIKFAYNLENFDIVGGFEFRSSVIQGGYLLSDVPEPTRNGFINYTTQNDTIRGGNFYDVTDLGAYCQMDWQLSDFVKLTGGLRWDNNTVKNLSLGYGSELSPRLALVYAPKKFVIKAIYAEAFKDASAFNKYSRSAIRRINNPTLKPERVRNYELTFRWRANANYYFEIIGYNAAYKNVLSDEVYTLADGTTTTRFVGKEEAKSKGIQLNSKYTHKNTEWYANYTFTYAEAKLMQDQENVSWVKVGDIAPHQINLGVNHTFLRNRLHANLRMNYVATKPTGKNTSVSASPLSEIKAYAIFHTALTYDLTKGLALQGIIENLTDREYWHPGVRNASRTPYAPRIPQYRRSFYLKILCDL